MGAWAFRTVEAMRQDGWIPATELREGLGLAGGAGVPWGEIEAEEFGADGQLWVEPKRRRSTAVARAAAGESKWITMAEAMECLGVCRQTIYRLNREGIIEYDDSRPRLLLRVDVEARRRSN